MMQKPWRIELFGGLRLRSAGREIARFQTYKTGALLAYLAFHPDRPHSREVLAYLLWPDADPEAGRLSLRVALNSLRHLLEPPGIPGGSILAASRATVQLNPAAVTTDVEEFEAALPAFTSMYAASPTIADSEANRQAVREIEELLCAVELYHGELLPGYYEEWILTERERLNDVYVYALRHLCEKLVVMGDLDRALQYGHRAVAAAPGEEGPRLSLMRLYKEAGRAKDALRQYHQLEKILAEEMHEKPSETARAFAASLREQVGRQGAQPTVSPVRTKTPVSSPPITASSSHVPLPLSFTRFIGRKEEQARLLPLIQPVPGRIDTASPLTRLVTLTGPGGTGKTRLALQIAGEVAEVYKGAVYFVSLADISDPGLIGEAILETLARHRDPRLTALEQIATLIAPAPALLLLDNFEHLAEEGTGIVLSLMHRLPNLVCLVTSRKRLMLPGEREFPVSPLPIPISELRIPQELLEYESVQLFVEYAQAARPDFQVTERNASDIAALCRLLEGLPLALEMAAARITLFTPAQIVHALEKGKETLVTTLAARKGTHARQSSLWSTLEWSFRLLSPELQRFFARLSVFRGDWSLLAAQAICEVGESQKGEGAVSRAVEYLTHLRSHSLITTQEAEGEMRFRMLETVRVFAGAQVPVEEQGRLAQQHAYYYLTLANEAGARLRGPEQNTRLQQITREYDNLRAALQYGLEQEPETALRLCSALGDYWGIRGLLVEGKSWTERALGGQSPEACAPPSLRLPALNTLARLTVQEGDHAASEAALTEALQLATAEKDPVALAQTLYLRGYFVLDRADYDQARACYEQCLSIREEIGDHSGAAYSMVNLGEISMRQGDYPAATAFWEKALRRFEDILDRRGYSLTLANLGSLAYYQGDFGLARQRGEEALALLREQKLPCNALYLHLGGVAYAIADLTSARDYFQRALEGYTEQHVGKAIGLAHFGLGEVYSAFGEIQTAQECYTHALGHYRETVGRAEEAEVLIGLARLSMKRQEPGTASPLLREALTIHQEIGDWRGIARGLEQTAGLLLADGRAFSAAQLVSAARQLRKNVSYPLRPIEQPDVERLVQRTRGTLQGAQAEATFEVAERIGQEMTRAQAIEFAIRELSDISKEWR